MGKRRPIFNVMTYSKKRRNIVIFELFCHYKTLFGYRNGTLADDCPGRDRPVQTRPSMLLSHDEGDWRSSGLLRQEREAIRPLCLDPS